MSTVNIHEAKTRLSRLIRHPPVAVDRPPIHRDPFDRLLVAQAQVEGITLLTSDPVVAQYPGPIRTV